MTKDKKLGRMSATSSDKRRPFIPGVGGGGGSSNNNGSTGGTAGSSTTNGSSSKTSQSGGSSTHVLHTSNPRSSAANIIAPPPRAHHAPASSTVPNPEAAATAAAATTTATSREPSASRQDAKDKEARHKDATGSGGGGGGSARGRSSSHSRSKSAVIKEKDARIAHLERELEIMEQEFTRELDKLSQNESETAVFWQTKHSDLEQQLLRAEADLRQMRQEAEARDADRDALRREVADLRSQVRGLKEFVSTSTRSQGQTSDEVFCEGMARLGNSLQNWVIVNFRKAKLDIASAREDAREELARLIPMYAELEPSTKVHLLQSIVSRILVDSIFESYFFGLSAEQAAEFKALEQTLSNFVDSAEALNSWRSSTLALLRREAEAKLQIETSAATERVIARVNGILDAVTDANATEARDTALRALVSTAADLARQLAVQKAVFRVHMPDMAPDQQAVFDPATMEDIGGEDEEALAQRAIACVTFPGIIKRGDENGGHMQYQNVIAKARVLCSPE